MTTKKTKEPVNAMAFYHQDGLVAAWKQAMKFAGEGGRIATLPEVIAARLNKKPGDSVWEKYYTTLTAEYFGFSKQGKQILIIAHGVGPMATLDGILKAYSWEYKDKNRDRRGGRITQEEFWDLEAGKFGEVHIVDFTEYLKQYQYPFIETLKASWAMTDEVLRARLGPQCERYVQYHAEAARAWHRQQAGLNPENRYHLPEDTHQQYLDRRRKHHLIDGAEGSDPYIIKVEDESNCSYRYTPIETGYAIAHLISTGGLMNLSHQGEESLVMDTSCHAWSDGVRLIGIKPGETIQSNIYDGPDANQLLRRHWKELFQPVSKPSTSGFYRLTELGKQNFTQYPKNGGAIDSGEPEYMVTTIEEIGEPVLFRTEILGYYGLFKYHISGVIALAPPQANAYQFVTDPEIEKGDGEHQIAMVQFYHIEADTTRRLIRSSELARNYDLMMSLLAKNK